MFEKSMPVIHKIIAIIAVVASCVVFALSMFDIMDGKHDIETIGMVILSGLCVLISVVWIWLSFQIKYKEYQYNDKLVTIYAGYLKHTLRIDKKLVSRRHQWLWNVDGELSSIVDDKSRIVVRLQPMNLISLKLYSRK